MGHFLLSRMAAAVNARSPIFMCMLLLSTACRSMGSEYGGSRVDVELLVETAAHGETATPEPEGWVLDQKGWVKLDGRNCLPELKTLIREQRQEEAQQVRLRVKACLDRERLAAFRGTRTVERLPATTLYLIAICGDAVTWKEFNSFVEHKVSVKL